jgi:glucose/arabinose dehydrogenase
MRIDDTYSLVPGVLVLVLAAAEIPLSVLATEAVPAPSPASSTGPDPTLPEPEKSLVPTVDTATAVGWKGDDKPRPADGFAVNAFASDLKHPRWLYVLPNGDVLVAETDAPPKPDDNKGAKGKVMKSLMKKAGSGEGSANRISLLRDADGDGSAELKTIFASGLNSPFGMALVGSTFYVANSDSVQSFEYKDGETSVKGPRHVADLPAGTINHHWTKNIIASKDGSHLYASIGSNSNVGENGEEAEKDRARIIEIDLKNGSVRPFATGLRNPVGLAWQPDSGALWTAVNERDELGNDLVPDYMTAVKDGAFYGWPYSYWGTHIDQRMEPQRPELVAKAIAPDYALGAHTASLGLTFYMAKSFPDHYSHGAFIGQHGSWNRRPAVGYKVVFVAFKDGKPSGEMEDFLSGFLDQNGKARGRPVGVAVSAKGDLLVADDVGGRVWRVSPKS